MPVMNHFITEDNTACAALCCSYSKSMCRCIVMVTSVRKWFLTGNGGGYLPTSGTHARYTPCP